jgi:hypothetical protein
VPLTFAHETNRLEIAIAGYQFPHQTIDAWDSNWLNVEVTLHCGERHFRCVDPCLTTFELDQLRRWFEAMANEPRENVPETFTEPNLEFVISSIDPLTLGIRLGLELVPPWESQALALDFPITRDDLVAAARAIGEMVGEYPRRGSR